MVIYSQQECIPVGCEPSAAVTFLGRCLPGEMSAQVGVCLLGGCLPIGRVSALGVSAEEVVSSQGRSTQGGCLPKGVSAKGVYTSPRPVDRQTVADGNDLIRC